ncbi:MAG: hypothetical protein KDA65_09040 [Planctomycetaceae bacterium]|nr:hypothetical protein [Planctomycetaceae bacterium]
MRLLVLLLTCVPLLVGCVVTDTGVTNPMPELSTVAIVPFLNLSSERSVDGRQFAEAYFAELQKVPGFEVVPVGVVETAMVQHGLEEMRGPEDAIRLAKILNVDAVVVGAVTDYKVYAPPRVGLKVSWYSPYDWDFIPGIPVDPLARTRLENEQEQRENMYREANRRPLELGDLCTCPEGECDGRCLANRQCHCEHGVESCEHIHCGGICTGEECPWCEGEDEGLEAWLKRKHQTNKVKWERFKKEMKDPFELHKGPRANKYRVPVPWPDYRGQSPDESSAGFGHSMSSNQPLTLGKPDYNPGGFQVEAFQNTTGGLQLDVPRQAETGQQSQVNMVSESMELTREEVQEIAGPVFRLSVPHVGVSNPKPLQVVQNPQAPPAETVAEPVPVNPPPVQPEKSAQPETNSASPILPKSVKTHPSMESYQITPSIPRELPGYAESLVTKPIMEYSRIFDATDADLVANFRDYYELSGDPRSGSWESRLHRKDEYIRFVTHLMIKEMLMLHGGEARRRIIFVPRKFK